jgi:ComF family protein
LYLSTEDGLNPLAAAIRQLKYDGRRDLAGPLGSVFADAYPFDRHAVLTPVPLHPTRLRRRGYNQAALLAAAVGRRRRLAVAPLALARIRDTPAQTGLTGAARRQNLAGAFAVRQPSAVRDTHVVVVDDVLTTGATADACATALVGAGAARVDVYTLGRAPAVSAP